MDRDAQVGAEYVASIYSPEVSGAHLPQPTLKVSTHLIVINALFTQHVVDTPRAQSADHSPGPSSLWKRCKEGNQVIVLPRVEPQLDPHDDGFSPWTASSAPVLPSAHVRLLPVGLLASGPAVLLHPAQLVEPSGH